MITADVEQGTPEWFAARLGIPTASNFEKIMTGTGKASTQAEVYMNQLVAEWYTGEPTNSYENDAMRRGTELEPLAREAYEFAVDDDVEQVGFVYKDDKKLVGCSPDGIRIDRGLEIKCPLPGTHVSYLLAGGLPAKYVGQVQGSMYVCDMDTWDFVSYCPGFPPLIIEVRRDEGHIKKFAPLINAFIGEMMEKREKIKALIGQGV